ncbi:MAG: RyR domain-containing protein [Acidobacteriota bacterium]
MTYKPGPIDTSSVVLSNEVLELTELLAKNTHEIWAKQRIADGWEFGLLRDDNNKKHPCLVPYEELPDSEKEYDRNTALETLKVMVALGYRISSPNV